MAVEPARSPHGAQEGGHDAERYAPLPAPALAVPVEYSGRRSILVAAKRKIAAYEGVARALTQLSSPAGWRVEVLPGWWALGEYWT